MIKLNDVVVTPTSFPDKTSQIWHLPPEAIPPYKELHKVEWEFSSESEFLQLAQLKMLLDHYKYKSELYLTYLPYGRQDKKIGNEATFGLYTFAKLLNSLNFHTVWCLDPHSEVARDLINNFLPHYPVAEVSKVFELLGGPVVCYPDQGASLKYRQEYQYKFTLQISAVKERNQQTGVIQKYFINKYNVVDVKDANVLIVDDLIDGGATFIALAELLKFAGAKEINLFATHGIFSKGLKKMHEAGIVRIFTAKGEVFEQNGNILYYKEAK